MQFCAAAYVKRFFLERSVLQYNPLLIIASSLLLAYKADEFCMVKADSIARTLHQKEEEIVKTEQKVLYALKYEIIVHTPCRIVRVRSAAA